MCVSRGGALLLHAPAFLTNPIGPRCTRGGSCIVCEMMCDPGRNFRISRFSQRWVPLSPCLARSLQAPCHMRALAYVTVGDPGPHRLSFESRKPLPVPWCRPLWVQRLFGKKISFFDRNNFFSSLIRTAFFLVLPVAVPRPSHLAAPTVLAIDPL